MLLKVIFDFCLLIYLNNLFEFEYLSFGLFSIILLITLGYVVGKYHNSRSIDKTNISIYFKSLFIEYILGSSILIIFPNIGFDNRFSVLSYILTFNVLSYSFNIINDLYLYKIRKINTKRWLYVGDANIYKLLIDLKFLYLEKTELFYVDNLSIDQEKDLYDGIIIENYQKQKTYFKNHSFLKNLRKISVINWTERYIQNIPSSLINSFSENSFDRNINNSYEIRLKRISDIVVSIILLIICSPFILISALIIKIQDGGPIFYSQMRTGIYGKRFKILKLRSMKTNSENDGAQWSIKNDPRVTKFGRFLRRSRIDELPQLFSVISGEMSLIGPRPERPEIEKKLIKEISNYELRNKIKPGLSGWAQVNYPYGASIKDSRIKLSYDLYYIKNFSLLLDFLIFIKTIKVILLLSGSMPKHN